MRLFGITLILLVAVLLVAYDACGAPGNVIYLSPSGSDSYPADGSYLKPFASISKANAEVSAGTIVYFLAGTYSTTSLGVIRPGVSGTEASPITYKAYPGDSVAITGTYGAQLDKDWTTISGLNFFCSSRTIEAISASTSDIRRGIVVEDCKLIAPQSNATMQVVMRSASFGGSRISGGDYSGRFRKVQVTGSYIGTASARSQSEYDANYFDLISIYGGDSLYIANNEFCGASHYAINLFACRYVVVEDNYLHDMHGGINPNNLNKFWLIQGNRIINAHQRDTQSAGAGFQCIMDSSIFRRNVVWYDTTNGGTNTSGPYSNVTTYTWSSIHSYDNYIYNNTFYVDANNRALLVSAYGIYNQSTSDPTRLIERIYNRNNIFVNQNDGDTYDFAVYIRDDQKANYAALTYYFTGNLFYSDDSLRAVRSYTNTTVTQPVDWWDANNSTYWHTSNKWAYPLLDTVTRTGELLAGSPAIDMGKALTTTSTDSEDEDTLTVGSSLWFSDGYGFTEGDSIMVGTDRTQVAAVIHGQNKIVLTDPIKVASGDSIYSLPIVGSYPDAGAQEYGEAVTPPGVLPNAILSAQGTALDAADSVLLTWASTDADSAWFPWGEVATSGTMKIYVTGDTTVTFYVSNEVGQDSASEYIAVSDTLTSIITNGGFETGTTSPWQKYENGGTQNTWSVIGDNPDYEGAYKLRYIVDDTIGTNNQIWQENLTLQPNTAYRLVYARYSNTDNARYRFRLIEVDDDYTVYGFSWVWDTLSTSWDVYTKDFTTTDFGSTVNDAMLQFYWVGGTAGVTIYMDSICIYQMSPNAPVISSPAQGDTGVILSPTISWSTSGAPYYHVEIDNNSDFSSPIEADTVTTLSFTPSSPLASGTLHYFRVRAKNAQGVSAYDTVSFTTRSAVIPAVPTPSSPATGAINQATTLLFVWTQGSGSAYDIFQLDTVNTFSSIIESDTTATYDPIQVQGLSYGETYFWRVKSVNTDGASAWSDTMSVTIGSRMGLSPNKRLRVRQ